jgi:tripartite motif-containing protein 71
MLGSLVVPGVQAVDGGQQVADQQQVRHASPEAVFARERSRTKFAHLGTARAADVAREAFPEAIERPAGGPPQLSAGTRVLRYVADNAAQLELPGGKHAVVESVQPMAIETSPGHRAPVDLSLTRQGSVFESVRPAVGVLIPRRLRDGVQLPEGGVSLTPVNAQGKPLGGSEGTVDGANVLYANTQTDTDTAVKPTIDGVETDTILRSVNSPGQLYFRVGLPASAILKSGSGSSGNGVEIVRAGHPLAVIRSPSATDAEGTRVRASMRVKGDLLVVAVSTQGDYKWPIAVDPELSTVVDGYTGHYSAWTFLAYQESKFKWGAGIENIGTVGAGEFGEELYHTQGESKIYGIETEHATAEGEVTPQLQLSYSVNGKGEFEQSLALSNSGGYYNGTVCPTKSETWTTKSGITCSPSEGHGGNIATYRLEATQPTSYIRGSLGYTAVFISQEKGPEVSFNESEPYIDGGRTNLFYGSNTSSAWLSPTSGALEAKAHDPGIGVNRWYIAVGPWHNEEVTTDSGGKCLGVQCPENEAVKLAYNPSMPDGEDNLEWEASDEIGSGINHGQTGLHNKIIQKIKVDAKPPSTLEVSGWPSSREISAAPHALTIEATDGTAPTASSGIQSLSVSVDGGPKSGVPGLTCNNGQCTLGPTTAKGKWTLNAENLTEGVHRLIVTATDNAGNEAAKEFTFDVRHGSPVSAGPGTVDPTTGQFKLSATDVSLAGAGQVSRVYESRNLTAGVEGPLGPQWQIGLSGGEGLTVLPTGSVVLTGSAGGVTTFTRNSTGEFESPLGDGNLKVEAKEKEAGKGITEYLLTDTTARTTTTFTQPTGTASTPPAYTSQFGGEGLLQNPAGAAVDAKGNVWITDRTHGRIVEFTQAGTLVAAYGSKGAGLGAFELPYGIAINQSTGNVYVSDEGNHRIIKLNSSGEFVAAFGWGVNDGKEEFEVCTSFCRTGLSGAGDGEFNAPKGVAVDSSGNVWVVDAGDNRVQEFNASGAYLQKFGTEGGGASQFRHPSGIAVFAETLYVTDSGNNRVEDLSTAGTYLLQFGKEGSGNGEFKDPEGIAVDQSTGKTYVTDVGNNRVQEFDAKGTLVAKFGSAGSQGGQFSEPKGVVVGSGGAVYVTDYNNNRVQEWAHPSWLPTLAEGPLKSATTTYAYQAVEVEAGKTVIEPTEALAPVPAGVSCGTKPEELKKGCRALTFTYATSTTATGINPTQWGEFKGNLAQVKFHAWDPAKGAMTEPAVAQYQYDNKGRLRAEWDPRIATALKTIYGYDEASHMTSVSRPGQEPWLLHYGTLAGDPSTGRLLSITRPAAATSTVLKEQKAQGAPANTAAPTLSSTTPVAGTTLSVSGNGTWTNTPLAYSYQWYDCSSTTWEAAKCSAIGGATNKSFTPQVSDAGYRLVGQVSATNATATIAGYTTASSPVTITAPTFSIVFGKKGAGKGEINYSEQEAIDAEGHVWVTDYLSNRLEEFSSEGTFIKAVGYGVIDGQSEFETCTTTCVAGVSGSHHGQFSGPFGIAINKSTGNIYVSDQNLRVQMLDANGKYVREFGSSGTSNGQFGTGLAGVAVDSLGNVWVADFGNNRVQKFSAAGAFLMAFGSAGTGNGQFANPVDITFSGEYVYVVDYNNNRVQQFTTAGAYVGQWGKKGTLQGEFEKPYAIATEPVSGDLYVSDAGNNRVQAFNPSGGNVTTFGTAGTGNGQFTLPTGLAFDATGRVYVEDNGNGRVERWNPTYSTNNPLPAPPAVESNSITTLEYRVPLSGAGLPSLTEGEVAKWGQTDVPVEAMAIFAPDKPMGWPAKEYERATINYMDAQGRTANVSSPSGGISTTEYNELNEVTRTLSPDNRVVALGETGKTVEASKKLDTQNTYSSGLLTETLGPEHTVKLAVGKEGKLNEEASARDHAKYFYDEGAPEGKTYNLVTKTVDGAQLANKEEFDKRTTVKSYGGQGELGWKLREPTSVTTDPGGLNLTSTTRYDENPEHESTGNVVETKSPGGRGSESLHALVYTAQFGTLGSGEGQLSGPAGAAVDGAGDVWVADYANNRIEEFSSSGAFMAAYGTEGSGNGQFKHPWGIAVNKAAGDVYVSDQTNNRVEEFEVSNGKFVRAFGEFGTTGGKFNSPNGVAVDGGGNVWVADYGNNRVEEFSSTGTFTAAYGSEGTGNGQFKGPKGIAADSAGNVYVTDFLNNRVQELSSAGAYVSQFGSTGSGNGQFSGPATVAVSPNSGDILVTDQSNNRVQEFSPAHAYLTQFGTSGTGNGQFASPKGIAVNASDYAYVVDSSNNRIEEWTPAGSSRHLAYLSQFGTLGSGEGQLSGPAGAAVDGAGDVWVADYANNRIEEFSSSGAFMAAYGTEGSGNGQFKHPWGIAVNKAAGDVYVSDQTNNRVEEFEVSNGKFVRAFGEFGTTGGKFNSPNGVAVDGGGNVWVADYGNNRVEEFSSTGTFTAAYGSEGTGNGQFKGPKGIAADSAGNVYVTDFLNNRVQELSSAGAYVSQFGSTGSGNGQFSGPATVAVSPNSGDILVTDQSNNRVQEFSPAHAYLTQFGTSGTGNGQFASPKGIAVNASDYAYVVDSSNNRIERWMPESNGNIQAHDVKTFYYTAEGESPVTACRNHPEWVNLPCQTEPAAQPGVSGLPELPVTNTISYNMWDEALETTEKFGSTTRKKVQTYDAAGRALTSEETSTIDTALPKVTNEYNAETGTLEKQSTTTGEVTKTITSVYSTLGQLIKYTDTDGSLSTYTYETSGDDRLTEVSIGGKGTQTYAYSPTTGFMNKLVDSAAGTFSATYDIEGKMLTEGFPNAMTAKDVYNQVGAATGIEYVKNAHCKTTCPETWFSDTIIPSIHGETLKQTSTLAEEPSYSYDAAGRLTQVQETPAGKGCKTRVYSYDEESNRTGLTAREPNAEGKCTTEGGTLQAHSYDSANRLIDAGVTYETFGNTTKLPASDASEYELTNSYYVDNQIASQTQNGETINYYYDPAGRTRETISSGKTASTVVSHYAGAGEALAWTSEASEKWTRNIPGPDGALDAIQKSGEAAVLQLHDLQGNIVGTAAVSEVETKLLSSYNSTEFGVPTTSTPPKYSWLGAAGVSSELSSSSSSGVATQSGASYVPQVARDLQTAPVVPPGAFPNGSGTGEKYVAEIPGWATELANAESAATLAEYAAKQEALRKEQEALLAKGLKEYEEEAYYEEEEEGEEEYAAGNRNPRAVAAGNKPNKHPKPKFCIAHTRPHDPNQVCCKKGRVVTAHIVEGGYPCDEVNEPKSPSAHPNPAPLDCPDGSYPGISYLTGKPACLPDGDNPTAEE